MCGSHVFGMSTTYGSGGLRPSSCYLWPQGRPSETVISVWWERRLKEFLFPEAICCTELKILRPHPLECCYHPSCLQLKMVALGSVLEAGCGIQGSQQLASPLALLLSGMTRGGRLTLKATGAMTVWKKQEAGTEGRQVGELGQHIPILALGFSGDS